MGKKKERRGKLSRILENYRQAREIGRLDVRLGIVYDLSTLSPLVCKLKFWR